MEQNWGIIGHQNIVNYLENSLVKNRLTGTYLFYGIANLGKTTVAETFADRILNIRGKSTTEFYPLKCLPEKKEIGIEQVREWRRSLFLKSFDDQYKVGLIYDADLLNRQSANALLKTIEEPTANTVIIIVSSRWHNLLGTILSRSLPIKFLPVVAGEIKDGLKKFNLDRRTATEIADIAGGRPGLAMSLASQSELLADFKRYQQDLSKIFTNKVYYGWPLISELINPLKTNNEKAAAATNFLDHFDILVREALLGNFIGESLPSQLAGKIKLSAGKAVNLLKLSGQARSDLKHNIQPRLVLENLLLNL